MNSFSALSLDPKVTQRLYHSTTPRCSRGGDRALRKQCAFICPTCVFSAVPWPDPASLAPSVSTGHMCLHEAGISPRICQSTPLAEASYAGPGEMCSHDVYHGAGQAKELKAMVESGPICFHWVCVTSQQPRPVSATTFWRAAGRRDKVGKPGHTAKQSGICSQR